MPTKKPANSVARADARDVILDAAEKVFSISGFDGTSMKAVAAEAGVAQSLLHYHYVSKEGLYLAVFERRASEVNDVRNVGLDRLSAAGNATVEEVLDLLLRPTVRLGQSSSGNFPRLLMRVVTSGDELSNNMIASAFDPFARRVIALLQQALPGLSARDAVWGYIFSLNVGIAMMAPTGRPLRLSNGECDDRDIDALLENVVFFASAGLRAFATRSASPGSHARGIKKPRKLAARS